MPDKLFISYARADDEPFVKRLHQDLTGFGYEVWWDREAMESRGRTFLQEIRDAIASVERLILVVGPGAVTPDGRRAVSASSDGTLKVWDLEGGTEQHTLSGHSARVWSVP